jgi:pantoate--beta-alanine ligase
MKIMIVTDSISEVRQARRSEIGLSWGFVPTMGYLHEGHLSLVRAACAGNDRVAVSIYVNPTQFAPSEDLDSYPRALDRDLKLLETEGVDLVFIPQDATMYPPGFQTYVSVEEVSKPLEGASRPTHFRGVTTIVAKLFNIIQPDRAYLGQKDAQQTVVLKQMVKDLNYDLELIVCPTFREEDGLAQSSRNQYLSHKERQGAPVLNRALKAATEAFTNGEHDGEKLRQLMRDIISQEPLATIDYVSAADPRTLVELDEINRDVLLSLAVFFNKTRLIDNVLVRHRD